MDAWLEVLSWPLCFATNPEALSYTTGDLRATQSLPRHLPPPRQDERQDWTSRNLTLASKGTCCLTPRQGKGTLAAKGRERHEEAATYVILAGHCTLHDPAAVLSKTVGPLSSCQH